MKKKIIIDLLTENSVSIIFSTQMEYNGKIIELERTRKAYSNSPLGRESLLTEIGEPYYTAVISIWGDTPTVNDPIPDKEYIKLK